MKRAAGHVFVWDVFLAFGRLGLTSFGGPIAHLGYFRAAFVERRRWMSEADYADLIALCQFLPGPTSSQVGFAIGLQRAGLAGGLAAWAGFTLPSALLLILFAGAAQSLDGPLWNGLVHGLGLVAVAVVAQAVWGMARSLCPDRPRAAVSLAALSAAALVPGFAGQLTAIAIGAMAGPFLQVAPPPDEALMPAASSGRRRRSAFALSAFIALLALPKLLALVWSSDALERFNAAYDAGALVFGGGHVVLPLLEGAFVPRFMSAEVFLAGYGAAQSMPGPLFAFAAYLGAVGQGFWTSLLVLVAIFLPGLLLVVAAQPFWDGMRRRPGARGVLAGVNAAVVGLLAAALYDPIWTHAVQSPLDFVLAAIGFFALVLWQAPALGVVAALAAAGLVQGL